MANISTINTRLQNIVTAAGFDTVVAEANDIAANVNALESTSLGTQLNENISGVQGLNTAAGNANIALLTSNLTGLEDQVIKDVSTSQSDLNSITGATVNNGFLDLVVTAASAEGVKSAVGKVASPSDNQLQAILQNVVHEQFKNEVPNIITSNFTNFANTLFDTSSSFNSSFLDLLSGKTGNVLQDVMLQSDASPINIIESMGLGVEKAAEILLLLQATKFKEAVEIVSSITDLTVEQAETQLAAVPTSLSNQITKRAARASSLPVYDVTTTFNDWNGKDTPPSYFSVIASFEELMIEFVNTSREITEIVFFGYEIGPDQTVTPEDIHAACIADSMDGIAFHYVILPNGDLRRGRPITVDGEYINVHNQHSIGICIPHRDGVSASVQQGRTVDLVLEAFWNIWPGGQVFDAEIDVGEADFPTGINISSFRDNYRKINYGSADRSYSTAQLISAAQGNL